VRGTKDAAFGCMTPQELRERLGQFAAAVADYASPLFNDPRWRSTADQLTRAANGAMTNYRSAGRARSHAEFTSRLALAVEEIDESQGWLKHLGRCAAASSGQRAELDPILKESAELTAILTAALSTARRREAADPALRRRQAKRELPAPRGALRRVSGAAREEFAPPQSEAERPAPIADT
jgi:four helix bundle protein